MGNMARHAAKAVRRRARAIGLSCALAFLGLARPAAAADIPAAPPEPPVSTVAWEYQLSLYGWATSLTGDIGVRNLPTTAIDIPFSQVLKDLNGAFMGSLLASNDRWLLLADVVFARLSETRAVSTFGGSELDAEVTQAIATGAIGYRLPTGRPDFDFAITGGARYMSVKGTLSFTPVASPIGISASQRQWWIDPTVGFFAHWELNDKWFVNAIADIGGFGVGSRLSSTGYAGVGYMWTTSFSTALGYRYLYEDYEGEGAKTGTFRYNTTMHGPVVALAWRF